MDSYNNFIGIDIGKFNFVATEHDNKLIKEYKNTGSGVNQFLKDFKKVLPKALCILEPTGGYEMMLLFSLCNKGYAVHRAHAPHVKNFIRSYGTHAKTDRIDARMLSKYGYERAKSLDKYTPPEETTLQLYELTQRRRDLKQMLVAEKNRLKSPRMQLVRSSLEAHIEMLESEMDKITAQINVMMLENKTYKEKKKIIKTIPGIGDITANELLILLPELGQISRREIAALVGLAPISNESGRYKGYRRTGHGRDGIKPALFLAAMAARNSKSHLKEFYEDLIKRGKSKMVALTALMRKIIVIANAKLRDYMIKESTTT